MKSRPSYTKPNSFTQQSCTGKKDVVKLITEAAHITFDEWLALLFETGCQVMESQIENEVLRLRLLTDIKYGFWSWWIWVFIADDEKLLHESIFHFLENDYVGLKMEMVEHVRFTSEEDFFIKETIADI